MKKKVIEERNRTTKLTKVIVDHTKSIIHRKINEYVNNEDIELRSENEYVLQYFCLILLFRMRSIYLIQCCIRRFIARKKREKLLSQKRFVTY